MNEKSRQKVDKQRLLLWFKIHNKLVKLKEDSENWGKLARTFFRQIEAALDKNHLSRLRQIEAKLSNYCDKTK